MTQSNDLIALWAAVLEAEPRAGADGLVLRAQFSSSESAGAAKIELYRIRKRAKNQSKRQMDPDDPRYDTSPYDHFMIKHPGADRNGKGGLPELHFYITGHSAFTYTILPPAVEEVAAPTPRKTRSRKPEES